MTFGERLARIRGLRGLTQAQLAALVGMNRVTISNLERGKSRPKWLTETRLRAALGWTAEIDAMLIEEANNGESVSDMRQGPGS